LRTLILWWVTCLIWSSVWLFIKLGLRDLPPLAFAATRLVIALAILLPILRLRGTHLPRHARDWMVLTIAGVLILGVNYALLFWGAQFIPSGLTAVLQSSTPIFGLLFGHFLLADERFTFAKVIGLAVGMAGVALISTDQLHVSGTHAVYGCVTVTAAAASVAFGYVFVKRQGTHLAPEVVTAVQMMVGAALLVPATLIHDGTPLALTWTPLAIACLVYLAVAGSILATWLNYWLLKRLSATAVLSMALVEPVIAVLLGALFLHERLTVAAGAGAVLVLASVSVVLSRRTR
jgi:drug/metabolite transporter (DMT)-like permease